ncbi:MAG: hypothetical protein EXQ71_04740 [Acidimicrobiia bacterium]|nr:hypothetical protein [Acidimicrobiia bacterium]
MSDQTMNAAALHLLARVEIVAIVAYFAATADSDGLLIALVLSMIVWPISLLAPMRWSGQISERAYLRRSGMFLPGFLGLAVGAFGAAQGSSFPAAALIVGFGTAHMAAILLYLGPQRSDVRGLTPWIGACLFGIAGVLADGPGSLGWNTPTFFLYGLVGSLTMLRLTSASLSDAGTAVS